MISSVATLLLSASALLAWADEPSLLGIERLSSENSPSQGLSELVKAGKLDQADYPVELAQQGSVILLLPNGPRTILELEIVPAPATTEAWNDARFRLFWETDEPDEAAVDLPVRFLFGRLKNDSTIAANRIVRRSKAGWVNHWPSPYRTVALIQIDTERPLSGRIRVRSVARVEADAGYLRGALFVENPFQLKGKGKLVGCSSFHTPKPGQDRAGGIEVVKGDHEAEIQGDAAMPQRLDGPFLLARPVVFTDKLQFRIKDPLPNEPSLSKDGTALFWYTDEPNDSR